MAKRRRIYRKLKSATIALQCAIRVRIATKEMATLKKEAKDVGKLKQNNEKLKMEMASLKAMLAAQAKGDASRVENEQEMEAKQKEIDRLEKRVAFLEEELERKKALVKQLEDNLESQKEEAAAELNKLQSQVHHLRGHRRTTTPESPGSNRASPTISRRRNDSDGSVLASLPENYVSPEVLAEHKAQLVSLEEELEAERKHRRAADGEIIKLRAAINGVQLNDSDVNALLPKTLESGRAMETGTIEEEIEEGESFDEFAETRYAFSAAFNASSCSLSYCMFRYGLF